MVYRRSAAALLIAAAIAGGACGSASGGAPEIHREITANGVVVRLKGVSDADAASLASDDPERVRSVLAVYTGTVGALGPDRLPVLGDLRVAEGEAQWRPRYPLRPGQDYTIVVHEDASDRVTWEFTLPESSAAGETEVAAVYPSGELVPENLLRVYVAFSAPMEQGRAQEFIRLETSDGRAIENAFVLPERELWNAAGDRLTLLFDPGRLKQEVGPNLELGAPLQAGQDVVLRIDAGWPDARGAPLMQAMQKEWRVVVADRVSPDPDRWQLIAPTAPDGLLELTLPEPLDHALMHRMIEVLHADGSPVDGQVRIDEAERRWRFLPDRPWPAGDYFVQIDPNLEDPAGNSIERLFDEPLRSDRVGARTLDPVRRGFSVAPTDPG